MKTSYDDMGSLRSVAGVALDAFLFLIEVIGIICESIAIASFLED